MKFGIDFGTTRTGVAAAEAGNYPIVTFQGTEGAALEWYPSVVAVKGTERRYGIDALECELRPGWSTLRSFKRLLSRPDAAMTAPVMVGHEMVPLIDLMTGFLRRSARTSCSARFCRPRSLRRNPSRPTSPFRPTRIPLNGS